MTRPDQIEARAQAGDLDAIPPDLTADVPALVAAIRAVLDVADEWEATLTVAQWRRQAAKRVRQAITDALGGGAS